MVAAADASLAPIATPTSAAARAMRSLIPSPQYMQVLPKPCTQLAAADFDSPPGKHKTWGIKTIGSDAMALHCHIHLCAGVSALAEYAGVCETCTRHVWY